MTTRERFLKLCRFEKVDRWPRWDTLGFWGTTIARWRNEGLPEHVSPDEFFGKEPRVFLPYNSGFTHTPFDPMFQEEVLEEDASTITCRECTGIVKRTRKDNAELSMPQFLRFPVESRADWEKLKERLDPDTPTRYPKWEEIHAQYDNREHPAAIVMCGAYGNLRNLFGEVNLALTLYDDPGLIHDIQKHWLWFNKVFFSRTLCELVPDYLYLWEDMCFKNGPLISPAHFQEFILPYYSELIDHLHSLGLENILVDTDGNFWSLADLFLEAGVNIFYPCEAAAGMDVVALRKKYGQQMVIAGGIDKRELAKDKEAVKREVMAKLPPLLDGGGFIPEVDHLIPPDVPFDNYRCFIELIRSLEG